MDCTDRYEHDLQIGDTVAIVWHTGKEDNRWRIYQIVTHGDFCDVHIERRNLHSRETVFVKGFMERVIFTNNDLVFVERPVVSV